MDLLRPEDRQTRRNVKIHIHFPCISAEWTALRVRRTFLLSEYGALEAFEGLEMFEVHEASQHMTYHGTGLYGIAPFSRGRMGLHAFVSGKGWKTG